MYDMKWAPGLTPSSDLVLLYFSPSFQCCGQQLWGHPGPLSHTSHSWPAAHSVGPTFRMICPTFQASCKAWTEKSWGEKKATLSALEWLGFWFLNRGPVFLLLELSNDLFFLEQKPLGQNHLIENMTSRSRIAGFKVLAQWIENYVREKIIGFHWC